MGELNKVQSGSPLVIPARTFNSFIDAARDFQDRQRTLSRQAHRDIRQGDIILVRNDSGTDVDRFAVLGVDVPIISPADNLGNFQNQVALAGVTPTEDDHAGRFVITAGPIAASEIGLAHAAGVCPVMIDVPDEDHALFADVTDGQTDRLVAGASGSAVILWREGGTGVQWAVVRIGTPAPAPSLFWAEIVRCDGRKAWIKRASGTLPSLTVDAGVQELEAWLDYSWHRAGDFVIVMANPPGISPPYTVIDKIPLDLREPPHNDAGINIFEDDNSQLAALQDNPQRDIYCEDP